ncbi:MAG: hypothetical protein IKZ87_05655 [Actinomycetaceae bacterium]|nr:hypothetical protein [Actinomycetaceae bacterium]
MIIAIPVTDDGVVDPRWGRARSVAIAEVNDDNKLVSWRAHVVRWDELHDEGAHGQHHARIIRFLRENSVDVVVVGHMGPGIAHSINKMGILIMTGAHGDARSLVQAVAPQAREALTSGVVASFRGGGVAEGSPEKGERKNLLG